MANAPPTRRVPVKLEPDDEYTVPNGQHDVHGGASPLVVKPIKAADELDDDGTEVGRIISSLKDAATAALRANAALTPKMAGWRQSLKSIKENAAQKQDFVIAVLGASGAGKSWLVNALLGDHIVPTSGMEACTSMPIEVSYHPHELVYSRIEFISQASWLKEITCLFSALKDVQGVTSRLVEDGQEAWERVRVVYPNLTAENILQRPAEAIIDDDPYIAKKLGSSMAFSSSSVAFEGELRRFTRTHRKDVELWPLIARMVVRCNAPVLKDGLTLVDLPGVLDSNQARASIYEQYLQKCDHAFIMAPIKRAATDHVARELLGRAFRAQLLMDQKYTTEGVTFIATCNDDISCKEIISQLELEWDDEWGPMEIERRDITNKITTLNREVDALEHEKTVLVARAMSGRMNYLSGTTAEAIMQLDLRISGMQAERARLEGSKSEQERKRKVFCARKRAEWSRNEIRRDFKNGLDDLCSEVSGDVNSQQVRGDINVFAVSAQDYLKLIGKSHTDGKASTFQSLEDTAIPDLTRYCRERGSRRIRQTRDNQAAKLSHVVEDIKLQFPRSALQSPLERGILQARWNSVSVNVNGMLRLTTMTEWISSQLRRICENTRDKMIRDLNSVLIPQMQEAAKVAGREVADHIHSLGCRIPYWQTLKAIFRRNGVWKQNDWNSAAGELFQRRIAASWARILNTQSLQADAALIEQVLSSALVYLRDGAPDCLKPRVMECKDRAIQIAQTHMRDAIQERRRSIQKNQQDISRIMSRKIADQLQPLYGQAMSVTGRGAKAKAMEHMRDGLTKCSNQLFTSTLGSTSRALQTSLSTSLQEHSVKLEQIAGMVESQVSPLWEGQMAKIGSQEQQANAIHHTLHQISQEITRYKGKW